MSPNSCRLLLFASNPEGTKIFFHLKRKGKKLVKGFFDFDKDKAIIEKYYKTNFPDGVNRKEIKECLKQRLMLDRNWEL